MSIIEDNEVLPIVKEDVEMNENEEVNDDVGDEHENEENDEEDDVDEVEVDVVDEDTVHYIDFAEQNMFFTKYEKENMVKIKCK